VIADRFGWEIWRVWSGRVTENWARGYLGGAENAAVENTGVEIVGVDSRGGKCRSGKYRSDNVWKAVKQKIKILNILN